MGTQYPFAERRKYKRAKANFLFTYQVDRSLYLSKLTGNNKEINALMLDIGEGGVSFVTEYSLPVKTTIFMKFVLLYFAASGGEHAKLIEVVAEVCYDIALKRDEHRIGIYFSYIEPEGKKIIADFVRNVYLN